MGTEPEDAECPLGGRRLKAEPHTGQGHRHGKGWASFWAGERTNFSRLLGEERTRDHSCSGAECWGSTAGPRGGGGRGTGSRRREMHFFPRGPSWVPPEFLWRLHLYLQCFKIHPSFGAQLNLCRTLNLPNDPGLSHPLFRECRLEPTRPRAHLQGRATSSRPSGLHGGQPAGCCSSPVQRRCLAVAGAKYWSGDVHFFPAAL